MGDVVQIDKTGENFRIIYDVKGRFTVHRITASEAAYKLCRVRAVSTGPKGVPYLHTSDGRTIGYPDPNAKVNDSIQLDLDWGHGEPPTLYDTGVSYQNSEQPASPGFRPGTDPSLPPPHLVASEQMMPLKSPGRGARLEFVD